MVFEAAKYRKILNERESVRYFGSVTRVTGIIIESIGPVVKMGELCRVFSLDDKESVLAEVVGFSGKNTLIMPLGPMVGIGAGSKVQAINKVFSVHISESLKGRILDGLGNLIDDGPPVTDGIPYPIENSPPNPFKRERIHDVMPLGIRVVDSLLTCGRGQRLGIFAGSGVGKSTLMGMIARNAQSDINVITLVGERGRELRDFIERDLGEEGLAKSIIVVATSDQPALIRIKSALLGTAIAEYFRDQGKNVLLMMDSVTRFAMAQREIGMATGEPPISRGYTPSVFTVLPKLLERTGNSDVGSITALYTVLVEGDDMNEPIADTVRGILDGHIVLSRHLANRNHYPAIDVLQSVSRLMPDIVPKDHYNLANSVKNQMAVYNGAEDLINIGAYKKGSNPEIDSAIKSHGPINKLLRQDIDDHVEYDKSIEELQALGTQLT